MAPYEDSDLFQSWFRLFDPILSNGNYSYGAPQNIADDIYHRQSFGVYYDTESNSIENDEIIAHTLQEEFSRLDMEESPVYSHAGEDHSQALVHAWRSPPRNYSSDHDYDQEEGNGLLASSSSSPSGQEEYLHSSNPTNEYAHVDEVNWTFDHIPFAQHVPRINGEIPSIDEATSDHQRLLDRMPLEHIFFKESYLGLAQVARNNIPLGLVTSSIQTKDLISGLQLYGFTEHKVQGDGNCQFRALSDQLYGTPENHKDVRDQIVYQLKSHPEIYEGYVPMAYDDYLEKMSRSGEWGDHVTLQAAADVYGVKIMVMTSFEDFNFIEILPKFQKPNRAIFLSFWAEVHYNSIYPQVDTSLTEFGKKRKWWKRGNKL